MIVLAVCALAAVGAYKADGRQDALAFLLVMLAAVLPGILWLRQGAPGLPVFPIAALAYVPYAALPIVSAHPALLAYTHAEVLRAAATVSLFLVAATIAWQTLSRRSAPTSVGGMALKQGAKVVPLVFIGLLLGLAYQFSVASAMVSLGSFQGLVRSIALTFATIACLLTGVTRAQGVLRGPLWAGAVAGVGALVLVAFASLFLVGGITYLLAVGCGYVIVARRVPWAAVIAGTVLVIVLHAGKGEMRAKYWSDRVNYGDAISLAQLPGLAAEWIGEGVKATIAGSDGQSALQRASILQYVLLAQAATPEPVGYLMGETYARLPSILIPRFLDPGKPASQVSMDLLNIRYGLQSETAAESTAVGWGLIAEGYANFGYLGVVGIGLLLGAFCAALANWSQGASLGSPAIWMSAAAMMGLINVEADFISLVLPLLQSFGAVIMVYALFQVVVRSASNDASLPDEASLAEPAWEQRPSEDYPWGPL